MRGCRTARKCRYLSTQSSLLEQVLLTLNEKFTKQMSAKHGCISLIIQPIPKKGRCERMSCCCFGHELSCVHAFCCCHGYRVRWDGRDSLVKMQGTKVFMLWPDVAYSNDWALRGNQYLTWTYANIYIKIEKGAGCHTQKSTGSVLRCGDQNQQPCNCTSYSLTTCCLTTFNNNYSETTSKSDGWIQVHKEHFLNICIQKQHRQNPRQEWCDS